jgi:hypothetical protein
MAFSDFTLRDAAHKFDLKLVEVEDLFAATPAMEPSKLLPAMLEEFVPLAVAISTEKARSEWIVAPILGDLRTQLQRRVSLFSGIEFTVESKLGLAGYCDFILSRSPIQLFLETPIAAIVEAKNENLANGLGQCVATMVGARLFNEREGKTPLVYGGVTSGTAWRFLRLEGSTVTLDQKEHYVSELPKLLGVLRGIWTGEGVP